MHHLDVISCLQSVGGPSAIYTVTVPVNTSVSSQTDSCDTSTASTMASYDAASRDSRKRRFTETEDDYSNLLGYQVIYSDT